MIAKLTGIPEVVAEDKIIIDVGGVGYGVACPPQVVASAQSGEEMSVLTHLAVRDDALDLYGFETESQLTLFEKLLGVSGVGPKSALGILSEADAPTLTAAITDEDTTYLTNVSGIGKKTAEKIVLELKDAFDEISNQAAKRNRTESGEAVEALISLGYSKSQSRTAVGSIDDSIESTENKIKAALKQLSNHE